MEKNTRVDFFPFFSAFFVSRKWNSPPFQLKTQKLDEKSDLTLVAACNGQFFGGGMKVAPHSDLSDGKLDIITFTKVSSI